MISEQNVVNLMFNDEVTEAVRNGQFQIWTIRHIAEGIDIMTGIPADHIRDQYGNDPSGTIFFRVAERFLKCMDRFLKNRSYNIITGVMKKLGFSVKNCTIMSG